MSAEYDERALPTINPRRCTGCGICAEVCPTAAVAVRAGRAVIVRPADCTFCEICESHCPEKAIQRPFTISFAPPARRDGGPRSSATDGV